MSELTQAHVQRIYRPLSVLFALAVVGIGGSVLYTGWSSSTITITPLAKTVTAEFPVAIGPTTTDGQELQLVGTVTTEQQSATLTVEPSGDGELSPAHATGTMTIINTTATPQPLAATTRLRSDSGIIVRTDQRVDVPAGGQVEVNVTADPVGETGNLPAGRFTIVALWPGLQSKIYGQLELAMTGGLVKAGAQLSQDALNEASARGLQQIRDELGQPPAGTIRDIQPGIVTVSPEADTPSASYQVTVKANVTTATFSADRLREMTESELAKHLADQTALLSIDTPTGTIIDRPGKDRVVVQMKSTGQASLAASNEVLQPATYRAMTTTAIQQKLLATGFVKTVVVKIAPLWRTVTPDQAQRITIRTEPVVRTID